MQLALEEVASLLGASCRVTQKIAQGYSIDSRSIVPGQLFFAIRGPRFDGHEFVAEAFQRGAVGAVVETAFREQAPPEFSAALLPVSDTTKALQELAHAIRRRWGGQLIAITGSMGKTTTKELIAALLARRSNVLKSPGNLNNHYGLPLALLALEPCHDVAVVEMAMSAPGEVAGLARIAEAQVGVVTNVAPVHLEFFESVESIARAKRELIENLASPATAVLNNDDVQVRQFAEGFAGRVVTFGFGGDAEFRATEVRGGPGGGTQFRMTSPNGAGWFQLRLPGRHNVENALAAVATASLFNVSLVDVQEALTTFQTLPQRSEILTLPGEITLIDDSYNSNPLAMERLLEILAAWPQARRRIVVAGEMLELGPTSPELHTEIGRRCAEIGVDWLIAVEGDARYFLHGAAERGLSPSQGRFFDHAEEAGEFCRTLLRPGDVVLVKGSRRVGLERVIQLLRLTLPVGSRPEQDVRRTS